MTTLTTYLLIIALLIPSALGVQGANSIGLLALDTLYIDGAAVDSERAAYWMDVRKNFGLDNSREDVQEIIDAYGTNGHWGFPLTHEEATELQRRTELQSRFSNQVILGFEQLPGYAGFYFDHFNGGAPTLVVTGPELAAEELAVLVPSDLRGQILVRGAAHTRKALVESIDKVVGAGLGTIHRIAVDVAGNKLRVSVADHTSISEVRDHLDSLIDVPYTIEVEPQSEPEACSSRDNCSNPMKAGIKVCALGGSCSTLGFGVLHNGDKQYLIAGHQSGQTFTHAGYGTIGGVAESEYVTGGIDAKAIYATDAQVSDDIFVTSISTRDITTWRYPSVGLTVWISGIKNFGSGTVLDDYVVYTPSGGPSGLVGASANYPSESGDSGAPIYFVSGTSSAQAVGLHSTGGGAKEFARFYDIPTRMGASILTN